MRVVINSLCAVTGGAVTHLRHLVPALLPLLTDDELLVVGNEATRARLVLPPEIRWVDAGDTGQGILSRLWWDSLRLPGLLHDLEADLLFQPANIAALRVRIPQVILIHNVAPFLDEIIETESAYQQLRLRLLRRLTALSIRRAERSIFISSWGKQRIEECLELEDSGPVIPFGCEHLEKSPATGVLERFGLEAGEFDLSVSHLYRYKKLELLIDAHARLELPQPLVLVGAPYDRGYARELEAHAEGSRARIVFTGALGGAEIADLMAACRVFEFSSEAENLPITLLEAMSRGCAILTNRLCSMPEVCGDAALYADPPTAASYAHELARLVGDAELRAQLADRGRARARSFRWSVTARRTLDLLREAARSRGRAG